MNISPMIRLSKTYWNRYFVGEISRTQKTNNHKDNKKQPHGRKKVMGMLFLCFLEVLFGFWPQVANSLRRPQWSKKYRLGDYLRPNISLESFFFSSLFGFWPKVAKPRKPKNTKKKTHRLGDYMRPETFLSNLCLLFFFVLFWFSQDFCYFWSKTEKTSRKPIKPKKTKKKTKKTKKTKKNKD